MSSHLDCILEIEDEISNVELLFERAKRHKRDLELKIVGTNQAIDNIEHRLAGLNSTLLVALKAQRAFAKATSPATSASAASTAKMVRTDGAFL
ncbi:MULTISPECIES: hypothetical protein [unclassified Methylobacterium]|uniref:hypothetical protein n=1 Tax=unclassified Methylobacterium TaxID=2615210 RepID=UPI00226AE659|nr:MULTISPECIES: hypothetical protein [unclassified Methylobacterium]